MSTYSEHYESALVLLGHADDDPSHAPTFLAAAQTHALLATMRLVEQILVGLDAENPISISDLIADIIAPLKLGGVPAVMLGVVDRRRAHNSSHSIAPGRERIDVMFARLRAIANYREAMSASQAAAQFARALNRTHFDDITREMEAVK